MCEVVVIQSSSLKQGVTVVPCFILVLSLLVSLRAFSQECEDLFRDPPLDKPQYSELQLERAMQIRDYSQIISRYPKIKHDIELKLLKLYEEYGDGRAFQVLFLSNVSWVQYIVRKHVERNGGNFEDLFQEGMIELLNAIKTFDFSRGSKLRAYIYSLIRESLTEHSYKEGRLVAITWSTPWRRLRRSLWSEIRANTIDVITESWIKKFAEENPQYSIKDIRAVLPIMLRKTNISLNEPVSDHNEDVIFLGVFPDQRTGTQQEDRDEVGFLRTKEDLTILDSLSDQKIDVEQEAMNEMDFLRMYYWVMREIRNKKKMYRVIVQDRLFSFTPRTLKDIADEFNVSKEYIRQIEQSIKDMIRVRFVRVPFPVKPSIKGMIIDWFEP